jgi:hypothetical protein
MNEKVFLALIRLSLRAGIASLKEETILRGEARLIDFEDGPVVCRFGQVWGMILKSAMRNGDSKRPNWGCWCGYFRSHGVLGGFALSFWGFFVFWRLEYCEAKKIQTDALPIG